MLGEVDERAQHLRRQVVDDVPAEVFESVADRRSAGAGHARDDEHLLLSRLVGHLVRFWALGLAAPRRGLPQPSDDGGREGRADAPHLGDLGLARGLAAGSPNRSGAAAPSRAPGRGRGSRRAPTRCRASRFCRWKVIAKRCASSRMRWIRKSASLLRGRITGKSASGSQISSSRLAMPHREMPSIAELARGRARPPPPAAGRRRR